MRLILLSLILGVQARAHEPRDGDIYGTFGPFMYTTHAIHEEFSSPAWKPSAGIIAEGDLDDNGGLEIAIFYLRPQFSIERNNQVVREEGQRIYVSMGYRHWFSSRFSAGLLFFSSYALGDPRTVRDDYAPAAAPKTSIWDITDYGLDGSIQFEPWRKGRFAAVVDARYYYSLTPKPNEESNQYGILLAVKYFIQGRDPTEDDDDIP